GSSLSCCFYLSPATPPAPLSSLSLHDALPISAHHLGGAGRCRRSHADGIGQARATGIQPRELTSFVGDHALQRRRRPNPPPIRRSEEHTSELQSRFDLVCRLLLEKKKSNNVT